jgi:hypothetical protein
MSISLQRVNRLALDGSTVSMYFGRAVIECLKATYGDKIETQTVTQMGSQEISARTRGTYSTEEATITMDTQVYRSELAPLLDYDGFGNRTLPIIIQYYHPDIGDDSDLLDRARFVGGGAATENTANPLTVDIKIAFDQLYWTNERKTRNQLSVNTALGEGAF